ncbi:MAG: hypothetical protein AAB668_04595 [Patescibacteria group bacterium]
MNEEESSEWGAREKLRLLVGFGAFILTWVMIDMMTAFMAAMIAVFVTDALIELVAKLVTYLRQP